jgi:CRISPR system Cascade subunit CasD
MSTLLLQLVGPMQSWGVQSNFGERDTGLEPSKSGVVGLLCAALGRPRSAPVDDLTALQMGVRVDREGKLSMDYHTAQNVMRAKGGTKDTEVSRRFYLADAAFLVGLSGNLALLRWLHDALRDPVWPLYLGRKAFVPGVPVWLPDGLKPEENLRTALLGYKPVGRKDELTGQVRVVWDDPQGAEVRADLPLSFARRTFASRRIRTEFVSIAAPEEG